MPKEQDPRIRGLERAWWQVALIAAIASVGLAVVFIALPFGVWSLLLIIFAVVFVWVLWLNPRYWPRRITVGLFSVAGASALAPRIEGYLDLQDLGHISFASSLAEWWSFPFLVAGVAVYVISERVSLRQAIRPESIDLRDYIRGLRENIKHSGLPGPPGYPPTKIAASYVPLRARAIEVEKKDEDSASKYLTELFWEHRHLLVIGSAGFGKTTFAHFVLYMFAEYYLEGKTPALWPKEWRGPRAPAHHPIPAMVSLRELSPRLKGEVGQPDDRSWILRQLADRSKPVAKDSQALAEERRTYWDRALRDGRVVLVLDGLDELGDLDQVRRLIVILRDAANAWKESRIVVASRPGMPPEVWTLAGFYSVQISGLEEREAVEEFVRRWTETTGLDNEEAEKLRWAVLHRKVTHLTQSPLMLTLLCRLHRGGSEAVSERGEVYNGIVEQMLEARKAQREVPWSDTPSVRDCMEALAWRMTVADEESPKIVFQLDLGDAAQVLELLRSSGEVRGALSRRQLEDWLREECARSGLIELTAGNQLRFWHRTFQEFFAAAAIARRSDWWRVIDRILDRREWEEVVGFLSGAFVREHGIDHAKELLRRVRERARQGLEGDVRALITLSRLLEPLQGHYAGFCEPREHEEWRAGLKESVMQIFTPEWGEVPLDLRIVAAEVIGRWGDSRFMTGEKGLFIDGPGELALAKYPVTVAEFDRFVTGEGYKDRSLWSAEGWSWRHERARKSPQWWEPQRERPTRPVVGVSWYEAEAYCRWLSTKLCECVRLPTVAELEAILSSEGRFPWGDAPPDDLRANFATRCRAPAPGPTPVGLFPAGRGLWGHLDLAGNVWEWCDDGPPDQPTKRWIKGGCWYNERALLEWRCRRSQEAGLFNGGGQGFRVGCARGRA